MEKGERGRCSNRWSLAGLTALVTGGSKGIGHAIVEELSGLGAAVHTCSRNEEELNKCLEKWREMKFNVTGSVCDVSSRSQREELMERVSSNFKGKLNILINNAGTGFPKAAADVSADQYSYLMATNLESAFHLSQLVHPLLKASGGGSIVFISSIAGLVAITNMSLYSATKGAMNQLAKNLACEWAKDNIRANSIAPGAISTPLMKPLFDCFIKKRTNIRSSTLRRQKQEKCPESPWGGLGRRRRFRLSRHSSACLRHRTSPAKSFASTVVARFSIAEGDGFPTQIILPAQCLFLQFLFCSLSLTFFVQMDVAVLVGVSKFQFQSPIDTI